MDAERLALVLAGGACSCAHAVRGQVDVVHGEPRYLAFREGVVALARPPLGAEPQLDVAGRERGGGLLRAVGPLRRLRRQVRENNRAPSANEISDALRPFLGGGAVLRQRAALYDCRHSVRRLDERGFVPDLIKRFGQPRGVGGAPLRVVVQTVGYRAVGENGRRRVRNRIERVGVFLIVRKDLIHAPGDERERAVRFSIKPVVVLVARVAVPVGDEDFERPECEKAVEVDAVRQGVQAGGGVVRNRGDDGVYVRPVVRAAVRLLLESPAMGRDEVAHRPLVQVAVRVREFARQHGCLDVFHVDVQA